MTLAAGTLNRLITIQQRSAAQDEAGQPIDTWSDVISVWANIAGHTGMRSIATGSANGVVASIDAYSIRIRYREGIDTSMRVVCGSRTFDIKQIRYDLAGREWTDLICQQGGNDG
ncbi:MAG: phage head closure protein [Dyella sp.]